MTLTRNFNFKLKFGRSEASALSAHLTFGFWALFVALAGGMQSDLAVYLQEKPRLREWFPNARGVERLSVDQQANDLQTVQDAIERDALGARDQDGQPIQFNRIRFKRHGNFIEKEEDMYVSHLQRVLSHINSQP